MREIIIRFFDKPAEQSVETRIDFPTVPKQAVNERETQAAWKVYRQICELLGAKMIVVENPDKPLKPSVLDEVLSIPHITKCRGCQAEIIFLKTATGKTMPVDVKSVKAGDVEYDAKRHISHFETCPQAKKFSKKSLPLKAPPNGERGSNTP